MRLPPPLLLALLALSPGCERPFVEVEAPTVEAVTPDLDVVQTEPVLPLTLRASSFRAVERVEVNGEPATYRRSDDVYLDTLRLREGPNPILVAAFDAGGVVGEDTLWAVYLPRRFEAAPLLDLPAPRAGHTATRLPDGRVLVAGGTRSFTDPALDTAVLLNPAELTATAAPLPLRTPRVGHAASVMPDGRVLLTGGARRLSPDAVSDLVATVELFEPATEQFEEVAVTEEDGTPAEPLLRAGHTAAVLVRSDGRPRLYVYGGEGDVSFSGEPALGRLPFIRVFRFEDGEAGPRLVAEGPRQLFRYAPIAYHTMTPLSTEPNGLGRYLVAGTSGPAQLGRPEAPFAFDFGPTTIEATAVGPMGAPRQDHAAAPLLDTVVITGGREGGQLAPLPTGEVFAYQEDELGPARFFRLPDSQRLLTPRWGHTATILADGRILVAGGFQADGSALRRTELFSPPTR